MSAVYAANILGSTAGALLTGFILMDHLSTAQLTVLLSVLSAVAAAALAALAAIPRSHRLAYGTGALVLAATSAITVGPSFERYYERLIFKNESAGTPPLVHLVENKSGVVGVNAAGLVYGGGVYDGKVSLDLVDDQNLIIRPFSLALFHPRPREVLMIGLATGAWAQVVAHHPDVERLTVVEINPGYLPMIAKYPVVAGILRNPKIEIVIDDGRRWINRHPERKFDAILQNTSWWFRPNSTNLLSAEYLRLAASRLREGGVMLYNATASPRAIFTGCTVFPAWIP